MMRRTRAQRIVAGALTFFVLFALGTPARGYVCAMHGGSPSAADAGAHQARSHHHSAPADQKLPQQCTCVGDCDAVATAHALPAVAPVLFTALAAPAVGRLQLKIVPRAMRAHFALPFANGPPIGA